MNYVLFEDSSMILILKEINGKRKKSNGNRDG